MKGLSKCTLSLNLLVFSLTLFFLRNGIWTEGGVWLHKTDFVNKLKVVKDSVLDLYMYRLSLLF